MGPLDLLNHLLNFVAPAVFVGGLVALLARIWVQKGAAARTLIAQAAINSGVGAAVLVAGLVFFGRDGKMATYTALVLACASSQWWAGRR